MSDRRTIYGTGKEGAVMQVEVMFEHLISELYEREARDVEKEIIKKLVQLETADWPHGSYIIGQEDNFIAYGNLSIFEYMKKAREAKSN